MVINKKILLFLPLFFLSFFIYSQPTIILNDSNDKIVLQPNQISVLEDKESKLTIHEILVDHWQKEFKIGTNSSTYNSNINSTYWIKFTIINNSSFDKNYFIESYSPHTEDFRFYFKNFSNEWQEKRNGQSLYFYDREFKNKNLIFSLPIKHGVKEVFYLKINSKNYCSFDFHINPLSDFLNYNTTEYFFLGSYYGILIIMALYNLFLFFSIKESIYIYYALYVFSGMLSTLTEDCLGYQFVWFKFPLLNIPIGHHLAPLLLLLTFIIYSRKFLRIKEFDFIMDKSILISTFAYIGYYSLHLTILPEYLYFRSIYLIPFILVYIVSIRIFLKGYKPARFFIFGYTIIFVSIIIIQLRANGTIDGNLLTVYCLNYGLVLEVAVLSFAMADRIKFIKKEKEEALEEKNHAQIVIIEQLKVNEELKSRVNKELEDKVKERTIELFEKNKELEIANEKLKILSEQSNQMSVKLDLDNWNLQKNIKLSIQDRMFGREVTYEEFKKIFPDESTCLRYLEELKWSNEFKCRKCENKKFINGVNVFTRKCTRCGYPESVTAYTLFHGIRFPIYKAFYMTYLIQRKSKITLDELSSLIDLRRNTCWNFKKKVMTTIDSYKAVKKKDVDSWEQLVMLKAEDKI